MGQNLGSNGSHCQFGIPCLNYQTSIEIPYTDVYYLQNTCMAFKWLNNIYFGGKCSQRHHTRMAWDRPPRRYILCCNSDMLHPSPSLLTLGRNRAPLAAILGFKSSTFPSSDCCLANCLALHSAASMAFLALCIASNFLLSQASRPELVCHVMLKDIASWDTCPYSKHLKQGYSQRIRSQTSLEFAAFDKPFLSRTLWHARS